ncbi:hypothetical protein KKH26_01945 [Patescibacteria group bacterium]|nr:hypothetical protein [Patescibacteria group bacterium]
MFWLIIIILAYFLFALVSLGDKYILSGPPNPKIYVFYGGVLGILVLVLIPFVGFFVPGILQMILCLLTGVIFVFALLGLFSGLERFEASRIIPAVGGFLPLFSLALIYLFSEGKEALGLKEILAFIPLVLGSVLVTYNPSKKVSFDSLRISVIAAFLFALSFVLTKYVYLILPFWTGFIWIRIGVFMTALLFIFFKEVRREIFSGASAFSKKTGIFFILNQGVGAGAFIMQNWAIALVGLAYLPIINALQGLQYAFLFVLATLISFRFPKALEEKISRKVIFQKLLAILFIGFGLTFLAFNIKMG